jgi:hypothetical protein
MEYLFQGALFLLIAFALLIFGTWRISRRHFARQWDRKVAPGVLAKGEAQGFRRGKMHGKAELSLRHAELARAYMQLAGDKTRCAIVDAIANRN